MRTVYFSFVPVDTAFFCALQTTSGAATLLLNGTGAIKNDFYPTAPINTPGNFERTLGLTSTGDLSGVNFTITGYDQMGNVVTESRVGPNNTTVYSAKVYAGVTSITSDAAVGTNIAIGTGTTGNSFWFITNLHATPFNVGIQVSLLASSATYTIQNTDVNLANSPVAQPASGRIINSTDTNVVSATSSQVSNYMFSTNAIRCAVSAATASTSLVASFNQAGIV